MNNEPVYIPRRVDDPPHLLLWSVDELAPPILGLVVGMIFEQALWCTLFGFLMVHVYRRFRDDSPDGFMVHWMHWYGLMPISRGKTGKRHRYFLDPFNKHLIP
tara:strand:- start:4778 stop:5086 length:309 start_codon:yes stop_codon:yes gene_type:complete